jgi:di/tricarboxylate transporter
MLMALAIGTGLSAGAFAPTSLFGIVSRGTARQANIEVNAFTLFAVAVTANIVLLIAAFLILGGLKLIHRGGTALAGTKSELDGGVRSEVQRPSAFTRSQAATVLCIIGLVIAVVTCSVAGLEPDIGVLCFAFAAALSLVDPKSGKAAASKIDWSTVLLVGGIITFVGVLQTMGCVDLLGGAARNVSVPILTSLVICFIGGLVSAFASTTGILAALMPLALPLVASGDVPGWAIISALAVCASIVDVSPFSTALFVFTAIGFWPQALPHA